MKLFKTLSKKLYKLIKGKYVELIGTNDKEIISLRKFLK